MPSWDPFLDFKDTEEEQIQYPTFRCRLSNGMEIFMPYELAEELNNALYAYFDIVETQAS